ncbi:MAG: hypothetical protein WC208_16330 [Gallionella sp.]|jgi:hypothetical protein
MPTKLEIERHELEDFVRGRVWRWVAAYLVEKTDVRVKSLCETDPIKDPAKICRDQEAIKIYEEMVDLPRVLESLIEYDKKMPKEEEKET